METYEPGVYLVEKKIIVPGERVETRDIGEVVTDRGAAKPKRIHPEPRIQAQHPLEERVKPKVEQPRHGKQPVIFIEERDIDATIFSFLSTVIFFLYFLNRSCSSFEYVDT